MVLRPAGKRPSDLNLTTVFITGAIDAATAERRLRTELPGGYTLVRTAALPLGANIEISAASAPDLRVQTASGTTDAILRGFGDLSSAVVSNVYIDTIDNFATMNNAYAGFFKAIQPTRTTVQPLPAGVGKQVQISVVSLK
jgi:enamine deaminase RidA (YjgF/YER057c/UK114 family)